MFGRGVSVGVMDGVTGNGVTVNVLVAVAVGLGLAGRDGVTEGKMTCDVAGAQALRKRSMIEASNDSFFIVTFAICWRLIANSC